MSEPHWSTGWTRDDLIYEVEQLRLDVARSEDEVARLRSKVRNLVKLLDDQLGTPCEQIRHQQEVERLNDAIKTLRELREYDWAYIEQLKTR